MHIERDEFVIEISDLNTLPVSIYQDAVIEKEAALAPFAWTEVFLRVINQNPDQVIVHIWPMSQVVILGMLDRQLPYFENGKKAIVRKGYYPVVRNIGGLAVVADEGVLNFSLVIPDNFSERISISNAYLMMVDLIKAMFSDFYQQIDYFEISQSYCPGNYDLSIHGKKFAGIAQRRIKNGIVVSIYLSVTGDQEARGELIADFYKQGLGEQTTTIAYPDVDPECMANLSELLETPFTVTDVIDRLSLTLRQIGFTIENTTANPELRVAFERIYEGMQAQIR